MPPIALKAIIGVGLIAVAASFLRSPERKDVAGMDGRIAEEYGGPRASTKIVTADGEVIEYRVCNRTEGMIIGGIGAMVIGLISTGLGELNGYFLLRHCRVPSKVSVATSVFVVALTALTASTGYFVRFTRTGGDVLETVFSIVIFTVPGVIAGAQIGSAVAGRNPQRILERSIAVLLIMVALLTLGEIIL